ncbi:MAG TPA: adenine deaminase C-terminal domain-containing protein [Methylomirabilota bacterium]|jgi:adenine deaminase|nr:adenine deaminase C-terminal domain-containing protein [Methylomirabilota bacterium]
MTGAVDRRRLLGVALGAASADLVAFGGDVVNVYTGEVVRWDVAVLDGRVAAVGPDLSALAGPETRRLDVRGRVLVPGFLDGHTHLDVITALPELLREAIPRGLTALVTEMVQVTSALGVPGARWFLDTLAAQPIHAYATAPVISYLSAEARPDEPLLDADAVAALLADPRVLGLGEVYWHRLLPEPERLLGLIDRARALGKTVDGHTAGARGPRLVACAAAGIDSCHEPITAAEALDRLRLGMRVLIREGSVRRDLDAVLDVRQADVSLRRAALASDGIWPNDLLQRGYMDGIVQRAIDRGLPPVTAYQMASLNAAEHFGLDGELGGIAPGRWADFLVLPDLRTVRPEVVVARGRLVARDGRCLVPCPLVPLPAGLYDRPRPGPLDPGSFRLRAAGDRARVRVIRVAGDIVTAEEEATLPVHGGAVLANPASDLLLAAACDRRTGLRRGLGVVQGFGLRAGAVASTLSFDTADLVIVGAAREALAAAGQRVVELGGGFVVVDGRGAVLAELPLPLGGVAAAASVPELAGGLDALTAALRALGCGLGRPLLTLQTLTFSAIPALRLTTRGLLAVKPRQLVPTLL